MAAPWLQDMLPNVCTVAHEHVIYVAQKVMSSNDKFTTSLAKLIFSPQMDLGDKIYNNICMYTRISKK